MQKSEEYPGLYRKMFVSFELSFKSLFFGRKWIIYLLLALFPLVFTLLSEDRLLGSDTVEDAFVNLFLGTALFFFFTFGCLIISLPFSADEISDHLLDLYIVRPISKEAIYFSRWVAYHLAIIAVNIFIAIIYFIFLHFISMNFSGNLITEFSNTLELIINNFDLFLNSILAILYASVAYGGLFLIIGFIGNKAFTIGVIVALFERFFLSLLFLRDQWYLPSTNLQTIAVELFSPLVSYDPITDVPDFVLAQSYLIFLSVVFLVFGLFFIRRKEFE
ncbi:MAG: hypothetical protein HeimC3_32850 [Candidatus Heimdallarchaeota archaeon LC_3]|nr:MAG: hypothetical protein HeimC3_32850 [Candidatus Heimdallarchaeota archaeon LC_3]